MAAETIDEEFNERKTAALELASRGFYVFPIGRGNKEPDSLLTAHGFKDATRDAETIAGWFDVRPRANVAVACGPEYGLLVLDVDVKNGANGMKTLQKLWIAEPTLCATTPSGGSHLYFTHPGVPIKAKLDGIDVKGADGCGYVLAPPSTLPNGAYAWRDVEMPVAPFPRYLLDELRADGGTKPKKSVTGPVASLTVPEGRRHPRLVELGAIYRGKGLQPDEIECLLWEHARRFFDPPFSRDDAEHVREIDSIVHWYGGKAAPTDAARALLVLTTAELMARASAEPDTVVLDPVLPHAGNLMIYGPTGGGKSHLALCIALAIARGGSFLGWKAPAALPVLFCDGEMPLPELKARLDQYLAGAEPPLNLFWAAARAQALDMPDLADPAAQARYLEALEACGAQVVIFDNLTCLRITTAEVPENSVEAWLPIGAFLRRLNALGIATITVHHAAKSGTQRGSSAHTVTMDTVLRVAPPGEGQLDPRAELDVEVHFDKHRRFGGEATLPLRAKVIQDSDGYATCELCGPDPLVDDVARLRKQGHSVRHIAEVLKRSKAGIQKALTRAQARGLLPLGDASE